MTRVIYTLLFVGLPLLLTALYLWLQFNAIRSWRHIWKRIACLPLVTFILSLVALLWMARSRSTIYGFRWSIFIELAPLLGLGSLVSLLFLSIIWIFMFLKTKAKGNKVALIGCILVLLPIIAFIIEIVVLIAMPKMFVDFPARGIPSRNGVLEVTDANISDASFYFSVSSYPSRWAMGGTTIKHGFAFEDEYELPHNINVKRISNDLFINGQLIRPGDSYERTQTLFSIRFWLSPVDKTRLKHAGQFNKAIYAENEMLEIDVIGVDGFFAQTWGFSWRGIVSMILGLIIIGRMKYISHMTKRANKASEDIVANAANPQR